MDSQDSTNFQPQAKNLNRPKTGKPRKEEQIITTCGEFGRRAYNKSTFEREIGMLRKRLAVFTFGVLMLVLMSPMMLLRAGELSRGLIDLSDMSNRPANGDSRIWDSWIGQPDRFVDVLLSYMGNPIFVRHSTNEIRQKANIVVLGLIGCPFPHDALRSIDEIVERHSLASEVNVLYFSTRGGSFANLSPFEADTLTSLRHVSSYFMGCNTIMFNLLWGASYPLMEVIPAVVVFIDGNGWLRYITYGDNGGGVPNSLGTIVSTQEILSSVLGRNITNPSPTAPVQPVQGGAVFSNLHYCNGFFRGFHVDGLRISGRFYWNDGTVFEGDYINTPDGLIRRGRLEWTNGAAFVGDAWDASGYQISGRIYFADGAVFEGEWQRTSNGMVRIGTYTGTDGTKITGRYDNETGRLLNR